MPWPAFTPFRHALLATCSARRCRLNAVASIHSFPTANPFCRMVQDLRFNAVPGIHSFRPNHVTDIAAYENKCQCRGRHSLLPDGDSEYTYVLRERSQCRARHSLPSNERRRLPLAGVQGQVSMPCPAFTPFRRLEIAHRMRSKGLRFQCRARHSLLSDI